MVTQVDDLAAVQCALEEAQMSLQDLDLAYELQRQEFFSSGDDVSSEGTLHEDDSLAVLRQAMEMQVDIYYNVSMPVFSCI